MSIIGDPDHTLRETLQYLVHLGSVLTQNINNPINCYITYNMEKQ